MGRGLYGFAKAKTRINTDFLFKSNLPYIRYTFFTINFLIKTDALALIVVEILMCLVFWDETHKIEANSRIKLLII
jgi:hypothetical protein